MALHFAKIQLKEYSVSGCCSGVVSQTTTKRENGDIQGEAAVSRKVLGRATYKAYRMFGITHLIAIGETPNLNDKVDFEQLPFRIFPPMFGFFFIHQDIGLPAQKPFVHEESIHFPNGINSIRIQDADGVHDVPIAEVVPHELLTARADAPEDGNYCVYSWIGISPLMIAKCNAVVPGVYTKVFGPASYEDCQKYAREHGGIAGGQEPTLEVLENTFRATLDLMPPGRRFTVSGDVRAPTTGWSVKLARAEPQGFNPTILILDIQATPPSGMSGQMLTTIPLRYEENPPGQQYVQVTIRYRGKEFTIGVGVVH
jgi:hypothetical protein